MWADWANVLWGAVALLLLIRFGIWPLRTRIVLGIDSILATRVKHEPSEDGGCEIGDCRLQAEHPRPYLAERNGDWVVITPTSGLFQAQSPKVCAPHWRRACSDLAATAMELCSTNARVRAEQATRVREENASIAKRLTQEDRLTTVAIAQKYTDIAEGTAPKQRLLPPARTEQPVIDAQWEEKP